jgi:hypothetical protein
MELNNSSATFALGARNATMKRTNYSDVYLSEVNFIDGQALDTY